MLSLIPAMSVRQAQKETVLSVGKVELYCGLKQCFDSLRKSKSTVRTSNTKVMSPCMSVGQLFAKINLEFIIHNSWLCIEINCLLMLIVYVQVMR
jgi:hypothetical protein